MKIIIISIAVLLALIIVLIISGIAVNKHNMKNDKYDLLNYFKKHKDRLSITLKENGQNTLVLNPDENLSLASTVKIIIAFNFVRMVENDSLSISEKVNVDYIDKFYIKGTDGGAHPAWKETLNNPNEVSLLEVAKGMMQFSSNACTDYLISRIGLNVINESLRTLHMNSHDKITYLTPSVLIPGYLADKKKIAADKIKKMTLESYQELSGEIFQKMATEKCDSMKEKAIKMLDEQVQYFINEKLPSSTTGEYADLMFRLGNEIFNKEEKELFSEILIGKNIKDNQDDFFWYKGGATLFVLTSALYKEKDGYSIAVSLFIRDDKAEASYWIQSIFNNFVKSIATDVEFRKMVKEIAN